MVKDYPYTLESIPGFDPKWAGGLTETMKKLSMSAFVLGQGWVQVDGPLSSDELYSVSALRTVWSSTPQKSQRKRVYWTQPMQGERFSMKIYDDKA
jgi:hypothetical protein